MKRSVLYLAIVLKCYSKSNKFVYFYYFLLAFLLLLCLVLFVCSDVKRKTKGKDKITITFQSNNSLYIREGWKVIETP